MNATSLRALFRERIDTNNQLILNAALLPEAGLLAGYTDPDGGASAQIVIENAALDTDPAAATVRGAATLLGVQDLTVTLTGDGDDSGTRLRLEATGIPDTWKLTDSVKSVPQYWASTPGEFGLELKETFFAAIPIRSASFVLATKESDDGTEKPGLNLFGSLLPDSTVAGGIAATALRWIRGGAPLPVRGTIALARGGRPPQIDLRGTLDPNLTFELGSFRLTDTFLRMRTALTPENGETVTRMELAGTISIGSPKPMAMTIATELVAGIEEFVFIGESEDRSFSLGNGLADIAAALGVPASQLALPAGLEGLSTLYIRRIGFSLSAADKSLRSIFLTLALPLDPPWTTPIPKLAVAEAETGWTLFFDGDKTIDGYVSGLFRIGKEKPIDIEVTAAFPDFLITGRFDAEESDPISVTDAVATFIDVPGLPDITIADLYVSARPAAGELSVSGTLTSDWTVPVGRLTTFSLTSVWFAVSRTAAAGFSGSVGGSAKLGDAVFDASYDFPGNNFVIGGKIPAIRIGELTSALCNNAIALPDGLNFTLQDSEFAVTKSGSDYIFFLRTELQDVGTLFFEIQRTAASGWGAAVGVDLSAVRRIGDLPGFGFMNAIDLTFERMALVLSSVDLPPGYTFPDLTTYKSTAPAASGTVKIPSGIGAPKQGINFYAQFAFGDRAATRNEPLLKLYDFFSLQRVVLETAIQVSYKGGTLSALMLAGGGVEGSAYGIGGGNAQYNMNLAAYLAVQFGSDGNAALFLRGLFKVSEPAATGGGTLTFAMELGLQPNGFYVAGSMTGAWVNPFGIEGISVSDAGLMVGMNWEGIPSVGFAGALTVTGFQGSLACIVNSENPVNSVLAGSLSDLSLGDIVNTFVGVVTQPDPAAKEIIAVLNNVSVEGINSFPLPASLADALDARDLKSAAAAFAQYGNITLAPNPEGTMLVPGVKGKNWFLTDKTNGVTHYEITRQGDGLVARQQAQLYVSPGNARIGMIEFPQGFRIYGQLDIFGFRQRTDVTVSINKGIGAEVRMSRINLFGGLLRVERAPGDTRDDGRGGTTPDGPYLSISTYARPPYNTPHFYISGSLSFLGLVDQVTDIEVSEKGVHVLVARTMFGTDFNFSFDFKASPLYLGGSGTAGLKLSPKIDLRRFGLGTYNIAEADFTATLRFSASGEKLNAHAAGNFYFSIPQFNVKLGPYSLDVDLVSVDQPLAKLRNLLETAVAAIGNLAEDLADQLLSNAKNFAELVKSGVITLAESLDSVLKRTFNVSLADLYATTQCFAGTRLAPRMMRPLSPMPAYTPAPGEAFPGSAAPPDDPLARLRELRDDLGDSPTGQWVLNIYNTLSEPLVHLYDFRPSDPDDPTFDQVLTAYNGYQVYNTLLTLLKTADTSQPFQVTQEFLNDGMGLVSAIIDLAEFYSQTDDPQRKAEGELIVKGITGLVNQVSLLRRFQGLNYEQIKEEIRTMAPPPNPFA